MDHLLNVYRQTSQKRRRRNRKQVLENMPNFHLAQVRGLLAVFPQARQGRCQDRYSAAVSTSVTGVRT